MATVVNMAEVINTALLVVQLTGVLGVQMTNAVDHSGDEWKGCGSMASTTDHAKKLAVVEGLVGRCPCSLTLRRRWLDPSRRARGLPGSVSREER